MQYVSLPMEVQHTLKDLIKHFALILTIFSKYEDLIQDQELSSEGKKTLGWLAFILGRIQILNKNNDIVQSTSLLIAVIISVFGGLNENKITVRNTICTKLQIKTITPILVLEENVAKMIEQIVDKELSIALSKKQLEVTIKKLNIRYQQSLGLDEIDERIFVLSEMKIVTPLKLTPFATLTTSHTDKQYKEPVKRVLTYKTPVTAKEAAPPSLPLKSPHKTNKILTATPVTKTIKMNNWLQDHITKSQLLSFEAITLPEEATKQLSILKENILEKLANSFNKESPNKSKDTDKIHDINGLHLSSIHGLLFPREVRKKKLEREKIMSNKDFHKAVIAASTEAVLFIRNSMVVCFESILELCDLQPFEFWKLIKPFIEFDPTMPDPLKLHFQQIEYKIITSLVWKENSLFLPQLDKILSTEQEGGMIETKEELMQANIDLYSDNQSISYKVFFQHVLHIVSSKIILLSQCFGITDITTKEKVWELMKYCLSCEIDIFIAHHIDQILMCAFYAILKMLHIKCSFNQIMIQYIELYSYASDSISSLFLQAKTNSTTEDLVTFYNTIFIERIKDAVCKIIDGSQISIKKKIPALAPESPLMSSLQSTHWKHQLDTISSTASSPLITLSPRTKALYTFGECNTSVVNYKETLKEQILLNRKISDSSCKGNL